MELRRRWNFCKIFSLIYVLAFSAYIIVGLQPAEAHEYTISGNLNIPSIGLVSDVTNLTLENHKLNTPDTIVGSYTRHLGKTLLIGHSTTVFKNLENISIGDIINYNDQNYRVINIEKIAKSNIDMDKILSREKENTLIIMTCAGTILDNGDASHRFIVTATEI